MILYYALTTYHIQCCVLHKLVHRNNEKAVLMLSDIHKNSVAFLNRYKNSGIFDDVVLLPEATINNKVRRLERKHLPAKSILKSVLKDIKNVLPVDMNSFEEVYLCPDHFPFGWYVIKNKIKYHCFEEGCGVLSDNSFMLSNMKRNATQYELMNVLGYFGSNKSCVEILADTESQVEGYSNDKMVDFSVKRILSSLDKSNLDKVLSFFGVDNKIDGNNKSYSLILTQHMANLGIMSLDDQHLLYSLLADYFLSGTHIIVKPHPDDIAGRYYEIFGNDATVLPFAMPSEQLPYCINNKITTAIAANSTAVKSLGDFCNRMICFDNRILTDFRYINHYYVALKLIELIDNDKAFTTNANEIIFEEIALTENININIEDSFDINNIQNGAVISDSLCEELEIENIYNSFTSAKTSKYIIFLNEQNKHIYFDGTNKEIFKYIRPIFITQIDRNGKQSEEVIYLYSTDKEILKKTENISITKELKYTGVTLDIHSISRSESEKIKMLEGVLEATEKRLNDYIENKKQLDKKIEELEKGRK